MEVSKNIDFVIESIKIKKLYPEFNYVSLRFNDGTDSYFFTGMESDDLPCLIITKDEIIEILTDEEALDENISYIDEQIISNFYDINVDELEYSEILENIDNSEYKNAGKLLKFIFSLLKSDINNINSLIENSTNKKISELSV